MGAAECQAYRDLCSSASMSSTVIWRSGKAARNMVDALLKLSQAGLKSRLGHCGRRRRRRTPHLCRQVGLVVNLVEHTAHDRLILLDGHQIGLLSQTLQEAGTRI